MKVHLVWNPSASQGLSPGLQVRLEGDTLVGAVRQENPVLGEVLLPFACRMEGERLAALPLPPPCLKAEGQARPGPGGIHLELVVELVLPPSHTWGERAFARILEALLQRALGQTLPAEEKAQV